MTEIVPGIHWIKLPISMRDSSLSHINAYLIRDNDGYLLVDTGWNTEDSHRAMTDYLAGLDARLEDISRVLVTHVHPDHFGMAGRIKRASGAEILMHDIEKGFINPRYIDMDDLLHQTDRMLVANGVPDDLMARLRDATLGLEQFISPVFPDRTLHHGEAITAGEFHFRVLWTPGHSSGHVCLYEPDREIFLSGDHILPTITPNISVNPLSLENPLGRYLESLGELRELDVRLALPGHDRPFDYFRKRIDAIIAHHEERNREILTAMGDRPATAYEIARDIPWGKQVRFGVLPDFHKRMAVFETLAHLDRLATLGEVDRSMGKGIIYYRRR